MIYALLPVWQADFGLNYGALAILRGIYAGTMATLQLSAGRLAQHLGSGTTLAFGTLLAALGYALAGLSGGLLGLGVALAISGGGSSTQHPIASGAVSRLYGRDARGPLSIYNFAGDLGKSALPAAISLLVTMMPWRHALWIVAGLGCVVAAVIALWFPAVPRGAGKTAVKEQASAQRSGTGGSGFPTLFSIGVLDTAVRMGLLTFLPFLLKAKGVSPQLLGTALALVFTGGAAGKFMCGWLGARLGMVRTVLLTEGYSRVHRRGDVSPVGTCHGAAADSGYDAQRHFVGAVRNRSGDVRTRAHRARIRDFLHRDDRIRRDIACSLRFPGRQDRCAWRHVCDRADRPRDFSARPRTAPASGG